MMGLGNSVTPNSTWPFLVWRHDGFLGCCKFMPTSCASTVQPSKTPTKLFPGAGKTRVWVTQVKIDELKNVKVQELENCYLLEDRSEGTSNLFFEEQYL